MTGQKNAPGQAPPAEKYLIGPQVYPAFVWTLRVSLIVLAIGFGVWLAASVLNFVLASGVESAETGAAANPYISQVVDRIVKQSVRVIGEFVKTALLTLGVLVIVFAVMERYGKEKKDEGKGSDPDAKPSEQRADPVASRSQSTEVRE